MDLGRQVHCSRRELREEVLRKEQEQSFEEDGSIQDKYKMIHSLAQKTVYPGNRGQVKTVTEGVLNDKPHEIQPQGNGYGSGRLLGRGLGRCRCHVQEQGEWLERLTVGGEDQSG